MLYTLYHNNTNCWLRLNPAQVERLDKKDPVWHALERCKMVQDAYVFETAIAANEAAKYHSARMGGGITVMWNLALFVNGQLDEAY